MPGSRLAPAAAAVNDVPFPFTRVLSLGDTGNDVWVLQGLLRRSTLDLELTGKFDRPTAEALVNFQTAHHMPGTGTLEAEDARRVLFELSHDSWVDPMLPSDGSWQYKIAVTITPNRALESRGLLLDGKNTILHSFPVRLHGHSIPATKEDWPAFDSESVGVNQFTSNGNTPTGLGWLDFNTPFAPEHVRRQLGETTFCLFCLFTSHDSLSLSPPATLLLPARDLWSLPHQPRGVWHCGQHGLPPAQGPQRYPRPHWQLDWRRWLDA
jgi:hypothetical protein